MLTNKNEKYIEKYYCKNCHYNTNRTSSYSKHLLTAKHKKHDVLTSFNNSLTENISENKCINCGKEYKSRVGLWYHHKKCKDPVSNDETILIDTSMNEMKVLTELVLEVIKNNTELQKQNQDLQQKMFELYNNNNNNNNINNNNTIINTNSHNINNKTFNLQVFLNEECKDAMNMSEFINSIQVKLSDLENIGNQGYIEGVTNIIINHLNNTEMYKRPVHCSDAKRETLYVKEENKWEKEGPDNKKMKRAVLGLEKKNFLMLNQWKEKYPKCLDSESTQSDTYMKMISKLMNGDEENINKVIKRVAKEVVIVK